MNPVDEDAYNRAVAWLSQQGEAESVRIAYKIEHEGFEAAGRFAACAAQCARLKLKPWEAPPAHTRGEIPDAAVYGSRPGEIELRDRLLAAGLSVFEPNPLKALARVGRKRVA